MQFIDLKKQQNKIREKLNQRISDVLDHGQYIMGPEVSLLEDQLAKFVNSKFCLTCSSGTDALLISLMSKNIGQGDAVITTPFTYIATAEVIKLIGATPIFIDIDPDTFNINPELIKSAFSFARTKGLNCKAIMPVDIFGVPADYNRILLIAKEFNLFVIEDAAQSFGSSINNKKACSFGEIGATSFFPAKPLGCYGDGGAIFTNDRDLFDIMSSIRVHGGGRDKYDNIRLGINGRIDTIQAAILLEKLLIFKEEINKRNEIANYYTQKLSTKYQSQYIPSGYISAWAQYSILAKSSIERNIIIEKLHHKNIPVMIYYKIPLHLQKVFSDLGYNKGDFPISESVSQRIFSIPMHPYLEVSQQDAIIEALLSI